MCLFRWFCRRYLIAPIDIGFLILGKCGTGIFRAVRTMSCPMPVGTCGKRTVAAERKDVFRPAAETMKGLKRQIGGKGIAVELFGFLPQLVIVTDGCKIDFTAGAVVPAAADGLRLDVHRCYASVRCSIARISAAFVSGLTLGMTASITPFSSIRYVERTTPMPALPAIFFSCQTP